MVNGKRLFDAVLDGTNLDHTRTSLAIFDQASFIDAHALGVCFRMSSGINDELKAKLTGQPVLL